MPRHHETRVVPYSAEQMFTLVADVARYAEFLPWVVAVRVRDDSATMMVADLVVGFKGLRESFTSRVHKQPSTAIDVDYVDGPLKHLHNRWRFIDNGDGSSTLDFAVDFAFRSSLFERIAGELFGTALRRMIGAFEDRARQLYGAALTQTAPVVAPGSNKDNA